MILKKNFLCFCPNCNISNKYIKYIQTHFRNDLFILLSTRYHSQQSRRLDSRLYPLL